MLDLIKEAERCEERAESKWEEYMETGSPSTERTYERNRDMAEAFRAAASAMGTKRDLASLRARVLDLDASEPLALMKQVKELKADLSDGMYLP